ncbi:MAG: coproporphyrinogen-III oxidase family protein [Acidimicrobiales bacterium]
MPDASPPAAVPHLYVHIPFCPTICPFCSFHVLRRGEDLVQAYLRRIDDELARTAEAWRSTGPLDTVYLGGGTPSHLNDDELGRLVSSIRRRFAVAPDAEWTLEAHPRNITPNRPPRWRDLGFNRISVGVQSTQDHVLHALGRGYDAATALGALDAVLAVDGWSVNADLITVAPGQDVETDLRRLAASGVTHLAAYTLTIEPGTPFQRRNVTVDEDAQRRALLSAANILGAAGLQRYEVSNHARPGHRCRHNLGYWSNRFWYGVGPSATSHLPSETGGTTLLARNPTLDDWLHGAVADVEVLDRLDQARQMILTGLRLTQGLDLAHLPGATPDPADGDSAATEPARGHPAGRDSAGEDAVGGDAVGGDAGGRDAVARELGEIIGRIDDLCREGLLIREGRRVRATDEALLVLDGVLARLW